MSLVAHVTLRATREHPEARTVEELGAVCEEIARTLAVAGWEFEVVEAREARCVYEAQGPWLIGERRCPETATEVVGGSEFCAAHAKGARRLMAALERTA